MKIEREPIVSPCPRAKPHSVQIPLAPIDRRHIGVQDPLGLLGSTDSQSASARAVSLQFRYRPARAMLSIEGLPAKELHIMSADTLRCYRTCADGGERLLDRGSLSVGSYSSGTTKHESASMAISGQSIVQIELAMRLSVLAPLLRVGHETVRRPFAALAAPGGLAVTGCPVNIIGVAALQGASRYPLELQLPAKRSSETARLHRVPALP